jgi:hypothetical protein
VGKWASIGRLSGRVTRLSSKCKGSSRKRPSKLSMQQHSMQLLAAPASRAAAQGLLQVAACHHRTCTRIRLICLSCMLLLLLLPAASAQLTPRACCHSVLGWGAPSEANPNGPSCGLLLEFRCAASSRQGKETRSWSGAGSGGELDGLHALGMNTSNAVLALAGFQTPFARPLGRRSRQDRQAHAGPPRPPLRQIDIGSDS